MNKNARGKDLPSGFSAKTGSLEKSDSYTNFMLEDQDFFIVVFILKSMARRSF
jgi:hypothetical protein